MSDTNNAENGEQSAQTGAEQQQEATPTIEDLQAKIEELTGHSRKWEDRAKENFDARKELDALKAANMTDDEKATAAFAEVEKRATDAEERASKAEAELVRYKIAAEFDLDEEDRTALDAIENEDTLRALAERLSGRSSGPQPNPAQGRNKGAGPMSAADAFAEAMGELF